MTARESERVMSARSDDPGDARAEALARYQRRGPVLSRALSLAKALACACTLIVAALLFATVSSLNHGTGTRWVGSEEPAVAQVGECTRRGPISADGFGFYWRCHITVTTADGRTVATAVGHSVVTPRDRGRPVAFREVCSDGENDDCRYGRPTAIIWNVAVNLLHIFEVTVDLCLAAWVLMYLLDMLIGTRRYFALVDLFSRRSRTRTR